MEATFVVVGGGIAGVSCAETLAFVESSEPIILISESSLIKTARNVYAITRTLTHFDVEEANFSVLSDKYSNIRVVHDALIEICDDRNLVRTKQGMEIKYKYLCLCMGARPKLIPQASNSMKILGIRDTDSVEHFVDKLSMSKSVAIVGNGGIASELVYKIKNAEIHWVIKDKHISATFVDPGAAEFFQPSLTNRATDEPPVVKRMKYTESDCRRSGAALGPDWYSHFVISGSTRESSIRVHYESEIKEISHENADGRLRLSLTNGDNLEVDLVISATGVIPNTSFTSTTPFDRSEEGYINVNEFMQTSVPNIYAAGDICNANWQLAKHWFQMKLWTQARQMGCYAAKSMSGHHRGEVVLQDFCFELFAHSTKLFGYKIILLGLFNGQKLGQNYEILLRMTKEKEYIKFVLEDNKLQGAILIGDTDLEEMCENLILNQLDLSPYGDDILDPNIDIEDYFD